MTREEAIKIVRFSNVLMYKNPELKEALDMAIADMEKQIPKKLVIQETDEKCHYKCECGNILLTEYKNGYRLGAEYRFCEKCGQALDWSGEND